MRAVRVVQHAEPLEALELQDIPVPEPSRARCGSRRRRRRSTSATSPAAAAASPASWPSRRSRSGMDVCGVVEAAGEGAEDWIGRRVVAMTTMSFGGMADVALVAARPACSTPRPSSTTSRRPRSPLPFHTEYLALHRRAKLQAGETLLVVGGASAVGTAAIQLGVAAGAHVIAIAGGPEKGELCADARRRARHRPHVRRHLRPGDGASPTSTAPTSCATSSAATGTETIWTCVAYERSLRPGRLQRRPRVGATPGGRCARCRWATSRCSA